MRKRGKKKGERRESFLFNQKMILYWFLFCLFKIFYTEPFGSVPVALFLFVLFVCLCVTTF